MPRFLLALAFSFTAIPALAMEPPAMSCADFMKLDDAGRMAAMAPAEGGMMASGDAGGMMASDGAGGMMAADDGASAAEAACEAHPDMMVGAAMKAGQ